MGDAPRETYRAPMGTARWDRQVTGMAELARRGLDAAAFQAQGLDRLRSIVSIDAVFFATVDPATVLFTSAIAEEPLRAATPLFLDNEFARADVNKFAALASSPERVGSLDHATRGKRAESPRYREVLAPLGLGDELRVALVSGGQCWGVLCLHREDGESGFSDDEVDLMRRLGPHFGDGLRRGVALSSAPGAAESAGPGIVVLEPDLSVASINAQADRWLHDIAGDAWSDRGELPMTIAAAAAALMGDPQPLPTGVATRLQTLDGTWITVHASPLEGPAGRRIAVLLEPATPPQLASLILAAYGLTPAQERVAALVVQGWSTRRIMLELEISSNTLQEHLGGVFEKFGIGSRRELVAVLSGHRP
ncbi:MAG: LuxR family transcriptional regulator [Actinomycetia bacterium]|nr:LuxR family transcriptional regulator [Actinomycetes bacterium]